MESIILAAGFASRFKFEDDSFRKFMLPVKNSVILNYVIGGMLVAGIQKINIIVDEAADQTAIKDSVTKFIAKLGIIEEKLNLNFIPNLYPDRENGFSLFLGVNEVESDLFILSMADHVFSVNIYSELINYHTDQEVVLATDPMETKGYYDLDDCTKVLGESNAIKRIGKNILEYNRLDMGAFIMKTSVIREKSKIVEKSQEKFGVSDVMTLIMNSNLKVAYLDFPNTVWIDVDNDTEYNKVVNLFNDSSKFHPFNLKFAK